MATELDSIIIPIRVAAEGVEAGIAAAREALGGLDQSNTGMAQAAKKAAQEAANAYKRIALEAQSVAVQEGKAVASAKAALDEKKVAYKEAQAAATQAANAVKAASDTEKEAMQKAARAAQEKAAAAKAEMQAAEAAALKQEAASRKVIAAANDKAATAKLAADQAQEAYNREAQSAHQAAQAAQDAAQTQEQAAATQAAAHAAMAAAAVKAFEVIVGAVQQGIAAYNEYEAAVKGLDSIASGKGIDQSGLKDALASVTDAMFDATAAAASFKNLLSRGYSLEQATNTINRLKDAAAFGRQANLNLADAVKTATEGIKNENSILVDNAGVTKNVAKMWQDYAKARGLVTANLTQAQKVEAEYLGIQQETALQVGDYAKSLETLAGSQAEASNSARLLATSYGEAMAPTVSTLIELFTGFLDGVRAIVEAAPDLASGVTAGAIALAAFGVAVKGAQAVYSLAQYLNAASAGMTLFGMSINASMPWIAGLAALVALGASTYSYFNRKAEEAAEKQEEEAQALRDSISEKDASRASLAALAREYTYLSQKTDKTEADKRRLLEIEQKLAEEHGIVRDTVLEQAGAYDSLGTSMENVLGKEKDEIVAGLRAALESEIQIGKDGRSAWTGIDEEQFAKITNAAIAYAKASLSTNVKEVDQLLSAEIEGLVKNLTEQFRFDGKDIDIVDQFVKNFDFSELAKLKIKLDKELNEIIGPDGVLSVDESVGYDLAFNKFVESAKRSFEQVREYARNSLEYTDEQVQELDESFEAALLGMLGFSNGLEQEAEGVYNAAYAIRAAQAASIDLSNATKNVVVNFDVAKPLESAEAMRDGYTALLKEEYELQKAQENLNKVLSDSATPSEKDAAALELQAAGLGWVRDNAEAAAAAQKVLTARTEENTKAKEEQNGALDNAMSYLQAAIEQNPLYAESLNPIIDMLKLVQTQSAESFAAMERAASDALEKTITDLNEALPQLNEMFAGLGIDGLEGSLENVAEFSTNAKTKLEELNAEAKEYTDQGLEPPQELKDSITLLETIIGYLEKIGSIGGTKFKTTFNPMTASAEDLRKELSRLEKEYDTFNKTLADKKAAATQAAAWKKVIDAYKDGGKNAKQYEAAVKEMSETIGYTGKSADEASAYVDLWLKLMQDDLNNAESDGQALAQAIWEIIQAAATRSEIDIDTSSAESKLNSLALMLKGLPTFISNLFSTKPKGGGGGKSKEEREAEEAKRAAEEAKRAQEEEYRKALERIDHLKTLDQLTAEQEIDMLLEVQRVHAKTAEQRMDMEERIYTARKELAEKRYDDALDEIDHLLALDKISADEELAMLLKIQEQYALTEEQRREMAEKVYAAQKELLEDAYNKEVSRIDRLRDRNEISAREEIDLLQKVLEAHAQTAEQREDIEQRLYDAQQQIRGEEIANVDRLNGGIIDALRNRYEEQRDAEIEHLNESKQAWKDWSDETCKSIQAQIDALDEQAEAENREKTDADNLRAIDKAKQALLYETDEYNRKQLEKQIAQLEEKRGEQLKKWERQDAKDALRDEMDAVKDKAQAEQEAIQDEIDRVKELYAERLKAASLQAEAERLLMKSNQEEILELIGSYAPDYEATGKTLGERLFAGIQSAMGNITDWYAAFVEGIDRIQQNIAQQTLDSIDRLHAGQYANKVNQPGEAKGVNVVQNMNFYEPVESPTDVARRVKQMNQRLADML